MGAEAIVIDTVHENPMKWTGTIKDWVQTDHGKKPVIKKKSQSLKEVLWPGDWSAEVYPYELDTEKNIRTITGLPGSDIVLLVPDTKIREYSRKDYENSFYSKHLDQEESKRVESLESEIDEKQAEIERLNKKLDNEREENSSSNKSSSSGITKLECNYCDKTSRKSKWESDDDNDEGFCPKCGQGTQSNATKV